VDSKDISPELWAELQKQMALCLPRGDFGLPAALCEAMREKAATRSGRNYWTAALLLARENGS
jgi:hypothetical protein